MRPATMRLPASPLTSDGRGKTGVADLLTMSNGSLTHWCHPARVTPPAWRWIALAVLGLVAPAQALADCALPPQGAPIRLTVRSCRSIEADSDPEVRAHVHLDGPGALMGAPTIRRLYTGALVTDNRGTLWMVPSRAADPCRGFRPGSTVEKLASYSCCDTGRWGKCVFGGRFLSDPGQPPINAFQ